MLLIKRSFAILAIMMLFVSANASQNDSKPELVSSEESVCSEEPIREATTVDNQKTNNDVLSEPVSSQAPVCSEEPVSEATTVDNQKADNDVQAEPVSSQAPVCSEEPIREETTVDNQKANNDVLSEPVSSEAPVCSEEPIIEATTVDNQKANNDVLSEPVSSEAPVCSDMLVEPIAGCKPDDCPETSPCCEEPACPTTSDCEIEPVCGELPPCCDVPVAPTTAAYNQGANIDVCGTWDFYVTGSFLYWQAIEDQLYAGSTFPSEEDIALKEFNWDWKPGFKIGMGYVWDYDNWDVYVNYTRFNNKMNSNLTKPEGEYLFASWVVVPGGSQSIGGGDSVSYSANTINDSWTLDHNMFDLEFARTYYNGQYLIFKAHYGLRAGWLNQKYNETVNVTSTVRDLDGIIIATFNEDFKAAGGSNSWLIGPRIGIYSKWLVGEGFRFFGNGALNLFYQKFSKTQYKQDATQYDTSIFKVGHNHQNISLAADMLFGVGWGSYFDRNNWYFDLSAGYEIQIFLDQNIMRFLQQINAHSYSYQKAGDLTLHGLNVAARFDF